MVCRTAAVDHVGAGPAFDRIVTVAALERIVAFTAEQDVVAVAAAKDVCTGIAGERVVVARSVDILDALELVALRIAAGRRAGAEIDEDSRLRRGVISGVRAGAAADAVGAFSSAQPVVTATPDEDVVAATAEQFVGGGVAGQTVGEVAANENSRCRRGDRLRRPHPTRDQ